MNIDLLKLVDQGGCSAKLAAGDLKEALAGLPKITHKNLLVDIETHDDGGVYKINDDYALVQTTDFFPPVCSDPYDYGQIAAANALSDVYAMGGQVLNAMNLLMFPAGQPLTVLKDILLGGHDKVVEAGGVIMGGHTITNDIPVYGLAVTGWVHPDKIVTNAAARAGDVLILTKPIGTGVIVSAWKNGLVDENIYQLAINSMKQLNMGAANVMDEVGVKCSTDITGFGLIGHALKMAEGSKVSININAEKVPVFDEVINLIEMGVIPGASFRNKEFAGAACDFDASVGYNHRMLLFDAQTSGGIMMCAPKEKAGEIVDKLLQAGNPGSVVIGEVLEQGDKMVYVT
ncbi:MAG: selenide, water dikinase SelD [Bacteroidetes bacterium 4572_114]|nr:MAG: selenide, water dikinase SelD [Bacteroidetes bacterium 4572_114]